MSLSDADREDTTVYQVVVNHEEQYSIWPHDKNLPLGWRAVGRNGLKAECLAYIKEVWTDMRPLSLRKRMEEMAKRMPSPPPPDPSRSREKSLVERLCEGEHPIEVSLRPEKTAQAFKDRIEKGYVHLKFTQTRGGTELGIKLDRDSIDLSQADFENQQGKVLLAGELTLDYVRVRCLADLDLKTLAGKGHLVLI